MLPVYLIHLSKGIQMGPHPVLRGQGCTEGGSAAVPLPCVLLKIPAHLVVGPRVVLLHHQVTLSSILKTSSNDLKTTILASLVKSTYFFKNLNFKKNMNLGKNSNNSACIWEIKFVFKNLLQITKRLNSFTGEFNPMLKQEILKDLFAWKAEWQRERVLSSVDSLPK